MPEPAGDMAGVFDLELNEAQADTEDISDEEAIEIADDQLEVMPLAAVVNSRGLCVTVTAVVGDALCEPRTRREPDT